MTVRPFGIAATALLAITLAGCSTDLNPGLAAQVNDQRISRSQIDDLVMSACSFSKIARIEAGGEDPQSSMAGLRQLIITRKVDYALVNQAAEDLGITVSAAKIDAVSQPVPETLTGEDADRIRDFFHEAAKAQLQQAAIGAHIADDTVVDDSVPVTQENLDAGAKYLQEYAANQDVVVNPEFGSWDGRSVTQLSGSLSVAVSDEAADLLSAAQSGSIPDLPPSQVCG